MSSLPSRKLEIWKSSLADDLGKISGAFCFHLSPSIMVPQTCEFLKEKGQLTAKNSPLINGFLSGMHYYNPREPSNLFWWHLFENSEELFNFDFNILSNAIRQLELHTDINLTFEQVTYFGDTGSGPNTPLLIINRIPIRRGVAFRIEERGLASQSIIEGDFKISDKVEVAQQHYSNGMGLLAGEDTLIGLIDAAFMQFYLSIEALLENHEKIKAIEFAQKSFGERLNKNTIALIEHVYLARHRFLGMPILSI